MALFQNGIDVSRYQGSVNWSQVAAAGKQFAIVRVGSSNSGGLYVDPYFLQNVTGAHSAGLRVGAYYYTYARTRAAVASELTTFLNVMEGIKLEYPVFVDVEDASLTSLGRAELTSLVQYAMDILYQRKWYAGWYSYTNYINSYLNAGALVDYPLWVADYRASLGYNGAYTMWQYSGSGTVSGISGACDLNRSYKDFLPEIQAGGYNNYGADGPSVQKVDGYKLVVFNARCEYFYTANLNDVVGYLPLGSYCVTGQTTAKYNGYDWVTFKYQGEEYWTAVLGDRNRVEKCEGNCGEALGRGHHLAVAPFIASFPRQSFLFRHPKRKRKKCPLLPIAREARLRGLRGCEQGATVERSKTGERAMFAPAGRITARAGLRSKLAAIVLAAKRSPLGTPKRRVRAQSA